MLFNKDTHEALTQGFSTIFNEAFQAAQPQWNRVAMEVSSSTKENNYGWMGKSTRFREWLGDRVIQNLSAHKYTLENKSFENTIGVDRDDIEDDNVGIYSPMLRQLGQDAAFHPDRLVFDLLKEGFANLCYDGQFFFDSDHPVLDANGVAQSVSNMQSGSETPWYLLSTTGAIRPLIFQRRRDYQFVAKDDPESEAVFKAKQLQYGIDARCNAGYGLWQMAFGSKDDLDATNYQAARAAMMSFKSDGGEPLNVMPNLLVVPPSLEGAAKEILTAERGANGGTNIHRNTAELLVVPYLA